MVLRLREGHFKKFSRENVATHNVYFEFCARVTEYFPVCLRILLFITASQGNVGEEAMDIDDCKVTRKPLLES